MNHLHFKQVGVLVDGDIAVVMLANLHDIPEELQAGWGLY